MSAVSRCVDDASNVPKKLREASVQVCECSKQRTRQDSPSRPGEEPEEPDDKAVVPGDPHSDTECHGGKMNALRRDKGPRGHMGELERSRGVEGIRDRGMVVNGAEHDGIHPSSCENEREVETNAPCRRNRPGGLMGEPKVLRDVEGDWSHKSDVDGVRYNGRRDGKDGATSSARCDSKRVETRLLAGEKGQYQQVERDITTDVPEASTPPPNDPRRPVELPNLPRRRGRIKLRSRKIRRTKMRRLTYQVRQQRRGPSRCMKCIGDVAYEVWMLGEPIPARYRCSTTLQRSRIQDRTRHALNQYHHLPGIFPRHW